MSASLNMVGLEALKIALWKIPIELTELADAITTEAAESAAAELRAAYPIGPGKADGSYDGGNLRKGVRVTDATRSRIRLQAQFSTGKVVRSNAPHAYLFETGTAVRYTKKDSPPRHRGFMPGANIFVPVVVAARREMFEDLVAIVEEAGIDVRR